MAQWLDRLLGRKSSAVSTMDIFKDLFVGPNAKSGQRVNDATALQVATVLACVRVLANGVAQVPLKVYLEDEGSRRRMPARSHPLFQVLHRKPNGWQTSFEWRETMILHAALTGSHFSFINRVRGRVVELIPFEPRRVVVKRDERTYERVFEVTAPSGAMETFPAESILHVRGPSWDGWRAIDVVRLARDSIGLSMAIEEQQSSFYEKGANPSGMLAVEGKLSGEEHARLKSWIDKEVAGSANAGRAMVMDRAAKWVQIAMTASDAQTLEQRRYQVEEICRALNVMPIMVGHADKVATYASAEQMFLAHVVHTLTPWYERIEQRIDADLLTDRERADGYYVKFSAEGLLRGSLKDTKDYLLGLVNGGLMTANEARAKLELDPDLDSASDRLRMPANIVGGAPASMGDGSSPDDRSE